MAGHGAGDAKRVPDGTVARRAVADDAGAADAQQGTAPEFLVLEAGRNDSLWDVFVHMPAALPFPIGSRFYDWKYESEPEPHMQGRRV